MLAAENRCYSSRQVTAVENQRVFHELVFALAVGKLHRCCNFLIGFRRNPHLKPNFLIRHGFSSVSSHDVIVDATNFPRTAGDFSICDATGGNSPSKVMPRENPRNTA